MGWMVELETKVEEHFEKYRSYSKKRDTTHSQGNPEPKSNLDDFMGEQVTN